MGTLGRAVAAGLPPAGSSPKDELAGGVAAVVSAASLGSALGHTVRRYSLETLTAGRWLVFSRVPSQASVPTK